MPHTAHTAHAAIETALHKLAEVALNYNSPDDRARLHCMKAWSRNKHLSEARRLILGRLVERYLDDAALAAEVRGQERLIDWPPAQ